MQGRGNYFKAYGVPINIIVAMSSDFYKRTLLPFDMQHEIELVVTFNLIYSFPMIVSTEAALATRNLSGQLPFPIHSKQRNTQNYWIIHKSITSSQNDGYN